MAEIVTGSLLPKAGQPDQGGQPSRTEEGEGGEIMFLEAEALSSRVWRLPSSREKYVCFLTDGKSFVIRWRKIKRVYNRNSECKKRKTTQVQRQNMTRASGLTWKAANDP